MNAAKDERKLFRQVAESYDVKNYERNKTEDNY